MTTATETDLGPLIWVKGEIDASLARAGEALGKYVANPAETAQLKFAQSHLHQAHGALAIVGLDGVTQFADAVEMLFGDIERGNIAASHALLDLAHNALTALRHYLDELVNGAAHQPLKLWPLYEKLQEARRVPQVSAADLFFPDLTARPPRRAAPAGVPAEEQPRLLREARARFERGFLKWLRDGDSGAGAADMREAVAAVERLQPDSAARSFWWATVALADALVSRAVAPELALRRLWGRIGTQLRRTSAGSRTIAERLTRDVLYHIAVAPPATEALREAKAVWQLDAMVPHSAAAVDLVPLKPVLRGLKDAVHVAKEAWNRFCAGAAVGLPQFAEQAAIIAARADGLPEPALERLTAAIDATAQWLRKAPLKHSEAVAMEVATALLLVEVAAETFEELDADYPRQATLMAERLAVLQSGRQPPPLDTPLLGEMSRRAQEKLFMSQVAREILNNLAVVEQTLDGYFRDPARSPELAALGKPIKQIEGALAILGQDAAAVMLRDCEDAVARLFAAREAPQQSQFEDLAHKLSGLGFFVEALQHGPADLEAILHPEKKPRAAARLVEDETPSVEAELRNRMGAAQALVEALRATPGDAGLRERLRASLESIREEASLVGDARLEQQARETLDTLRREPEGVEAPQVADLVPAATPAAALAAAEVLDQTQEEIDAELLGIFVEEAHEVLASVGEQLARSRAEPHNQEVLTTIRRGFHTLKGSGRMVGLKDLGEAAWAVEQVMNHWLQREEDADDALHALIDAAHALFGDWVAQLEGGGSPHRDAGALLAMARGLLDAEAPAAARAAAPPPVPPAEEYVEALEEGAVVVPLEEPGDEDEQALVTAPGGDVIDITAGAEGAGDEVRVGDILLEHRIYDMYLGEARQHLGVLRRELARMHLNPAVLPAEATVRAAHTLAGISGTVGFAPVHDLGRSLEHAMARVAGIGLPASGDESELLNRAASTLEGMIAAIGARRPPVPAHDLALRLDALTPAPASPVFPLELEDVLEEAGAAEEPPESIDIPALEALPDEIEVLPLEEPLAGATAADFGAAAARGEAQEIVVETPLDFDFSALGVAPPAAVEEAAAEAGTAPPGEWPAEAAATPPPQAPAAPPAEAAQALAEAVQEAVPELVAEAVAELAPEAAPETPPEAVAAAMPAAAPEAPTAAFPELVPEAALAAAPEPTPQAIAEPLVEAVPQPPPAWAPPAAAEPAVAAATEARPAEAGEKRKMRLQDEIDESLLPIFLEEAHDLMGEINDHVRRWKDATAEPEIARGLKRLLHTLKGSARMAGVMGLGELVHSMETRVEDAVALNACTPRFYDEFDTSLDRCAVLLERLRSGAWSEAPIAEPVEDTLAEEALASAPEPAPVPAAAPPARVAAPAPAPAPAAAPALPAAAARAVEAEGAAQMLRVRADMVDRFVNEAGEMAIARSRIEGEMRTLRHSLLDLTDNVIRLRTQLRELEIQAESQMQSRLAQAEAQHADFDPLEIDRFTRLQELTRMIAESVNDVSTVQHNVLRNLDQADAALGSQGRLNRDLQQALMSVRMVPFNSAADRLHRIVRQTAKELGKKATLDIRGGQVELDRGVLDKMTGPLEHLLRNAVGHGLERAAERAAAGKPEIGQITLSLAQEGNEVAIHIADDGQGLDYEGIRRKAVENGLLDAHAHPDAAELAEMIFRPGFSTAAEVSAISGRGVGMDVVKSTAMAMGGRLEVSSEAGRGSTFRVYLPLTLAVMQALVVRVAGRSYAIPSTMVEQVLELKAGPMEDIQRAGSTEWLGNSYPYRYLPRLLGDYETHAQPARYQWLLLTRSGAQRVAVQVDELRGNQEIVVKKTGAQLARVIGIAGATVLGDGEIVLIVNPVALASRESRHRAPEPSAGVPAPREPEVVDTRPTVMVVDDSLTVRKITGRLLEREGYRVVTAKDGVDALEQLLDVVPDAMLVDIEMPRMDGFDLTRNIRGDERLRHVPIVMITSRIADKHRNYAREIGVDHYLGKPYDEEQLLGILAGYTRRGVAAH